MGKRKSFLTALLAAGGLCLCLGMPVQAQQEPYCGFVQAQQGVMWMNADGTFLKDSWLDVAGLRYHLDQNGYVQVGLTEIEGKFYYLYPGYMATAGWLQVGDGIYYFQADGTMAVNTVVDGFVLGNDGRLTGVLAAAAAQQPEEMTALQQKVYEIIAAVTTPDMTAEQKLRACYQYVMDAGSYKRNTEVPSGDWTGRYAWEFLSTGRGNCYRYACGVAYLAKALGYESRVVTGTVRSLKGGQTPHGWAEVYINGSWLVFDAVMEDARHVDMFGRTYENYHYSPLLKAAEWEVKF